MWFAATGLDDAMARGAERIGYRQIDGEWRRAHHLDAAHLEHAWSNFSRCAEAMFRQGARLDPVPWRQALRHLCQRTEDGGADWWLGGSAALAVRGVPIEPGDLDIVCAGNDVHRLAELMLDTLVEPVGPELNEGDDWISDWWGRAFPGARVEWVAGVHPEADRPEPSDFGPWAAARLESVQWERWRIRVPPLALQRAVSQRRGLTTRVAAIDALIGNS